MLSTMTRRYRHPCRNELHLTLFKGTIACGEREPQRLTVSKMVLDRTLNLQYSVSREGEEVVGYLTKRIWSAYGNIGTRRLTLFEIGYRNLRAGCFELPQFQKEQILKPTESLTLRAHLLKESGEGVIGKNGEALTPWIELKSQRVHSTCLFERNLVRGKRYAHSTSVAEGKEPKSADLKKDAAHVSSVKITCIHSDEQHLPPKEVPKYMKRLSAIWDLSKDEGQLVFGLFNLLNSIDLWVAAYKKLAPNPGSMTPGGAGGTIDGTSLKSLVALKNSIVDGSFEFGITRRVYIPKPNGKERPLGIPEFQDRLVQEVIRNLLEAVYEPRFCESSHAFRPGRSQHTCLKYVRQHFRGCNWIIEGDITKCFDTISHDIVMKLLSKRIRDQRFLNLVRKSLKTNLLLPGGAKEKVAIGTPQGGIFSPLLSNIILHELDLFIARLKNIVDRGKKRKQKSIYASLMQKSYSSKDKKERLQYKKQARMHGSGDPFDPNFLRIVYTRFADDFIIGVLGSKSLSLRIKKLISRFLKTRLKLTLNEEKTSCTRTLRKRVSFLGYLISYGPMNTFPSRRRYQGKWRKIKVFRRGTLRLLVDQNKVINRLHTKGFCDKKGSPLANFRYFQDPQSYSISQISSVIRGLANYYHLANNKVQFVSRITYIMQHSLAKMLAAKFKLRTRARVFQIAGRDLSKLLGSKKAAGVTDQQLLGWAREAGGNIKLPSRLPGLPYTRARFISKPDIKPLPSNWKANFRNKIIQDPLKGLEWRSLRGRTVLEASCAVCGSTQNVEMHHVRGLKSLKGVDKVEQLMIAARRKQIPLCRDHHLEIHGRKRRN